MLHLHTSNRLEKLCDALAEVVGDSPGDAFLPETIVVQSRGMQRWLALQLAGKLGVWANAEYPFPQKFLWGVFQDSLGEERTDTSPFDWQNLEWSVMRKLPEFLRRPEFAPIRHYLKDRDDLLKRFQLAHRIARTFDQYVVYRPEFLEHWETHRPGLEADQLDYHRKRPDQGDWQEILWRTLVREFGPHHRAAVRKRFAALPPEQIVAPARTCIFGLSTLAPSQLEALGHIARATDIHLFQVIPCRGYYADLASHSFLRRLRRAGQDPEALGFEQGNELLASMGRLGGDFTWNLLGLDHVTEHEHDAPPGRATTLTQLQDDLYHLRPGDGPYEIDDSIQVHACHGTMREVEVLKNRLLDRLESQPDLHPRDVLVMAPDIEQYAQAIEAVFAGDLPYSLADRPRQRTNPAGEALLQLVDLLASRFEATRVLEFLDLPVVRDRFGFEESDVDQVRLWAENLRVKWGRDAGHRGQLEVPEFEEATWQHLLNRLFAGYAIGGEEPTFFHDILTEPDVEAGLAVTLGRLSACLRQLFAASERAGRRHTLADWEEMLLGLLRHPDSEPDEVYQVADLAEHFATLRAAHAASGFDERLPLDVLRHWLEREMTEHRNESPFLGGGITCCNLVPMRSIPARVICILGLNDGDYPRLHRRPGFDLMAAKRRRGDRSRREDDRYLFLEALLSARDLLYLSYHGMGIRDNTARPPSVLVAELLDALGDTDRHRVMEHPLQAFSRRNFDPADSARRSFSSADLAAAEALGGVPATPPNLFTSPRPGSTLVAEVHLDDFCSFFDSPSHWFCTRCLGMRFSEFDRTPDNRLATFPNELDKFLLRTAYLEHGDETETRGKAEGLLPPGQAGHVYGLQMLRDARVFREKLAGLRPGPPRAEDIDLTIGGLRIHGTIDDIYENHALRWRFGTWRPKDEFRTWICHLLLNSISTIKSVGMGRENKARGWMIRAESSPDKAREELVKLVQIFQAGQSRPLPFPATAKAYAGPRLGDKADPATARLSALGAWYGNPWSRSERDALPAHRFLYRDREPFDDPEFDALVRDLALWSWRRPRG